MCTVLCDVHCAVCTGAPKRIEENLLFDSESILVAICAQAVGKGENGVVSKTLWVKLSASRRFILIRGHADFEVNSSPL